MSVPRERLEFRAEARQKTFGAGMLNLMRKEANVKGITGVLFRSRLRDVSVGTSCLACPVANPGQARQLVPTATEPLLLAEIFQIGVKIREVGILQIVEQAGGH